MRYTSVILLMLANITEAQEPATAFEALAGTLKHDLTLSQKKIEIQRFNDADDRLASLSSSGLITSNDDSKPAPTASFNQFFQDAYIALTLGQLESSLVLYKKAAEIKPHHSEILYSIGSIYHKLQMFKEAEEYYQQALIYDPTHRLGLANYLAVISDRDPRYALEEMLKLEEINPNFAPVLLQIGLIYANNGQFQNAESYLLRAYKAEPEEMTYLYNLAVLYDHEQLFDQATVLYKEILRRNQSENAALPTSVDKIRSRLRTINLKSSASQNQIN